MPDLPAKPEDRMHAFWRIFGGTLLSIGALAFITICQYFNSTLNDIRKDVTQISERSSNDFVKRNEMKAVWEAIRKLRDQDAHISALNERVKMLESRDKK